jgi:ELP3 family radical SAM enzyme/protein acetyltransferase
MLKRNCWKIDGHFMPNLPGSTIELDEDMLLNNVVGIKSRKKNVYELQDPGIQVDQIKIYPTAVTPYTEIEKWFLDKSYVPYDDIKLFDLLLKFKTMVFPWIRINRIVRDFFAEAIYENGGREILNMRTELQKEMEKCGVSCQCIRCREVKSKEWDGRYVLNVTKYGASNGDEYFISADSKDGKTLYGFVRLRLDDGFNKVFLELNNAALVREVHVYSQSTFVGEKGNSVQHRGLGTRLLREAENIARQKYYYKIAVIAGVGAQTFYEKLDYVRSGDGGDFMIKWLCR